MSLRAQSGGEDARRELAEASPARLIFKYSWPALVAMSLNALYSVVDRFYIGHGCGEAAIAALTLAFPVMMLFAAFGVFVGVGHAALMSIRLGARDMDACEKLLGQLVAFKLAFFCVLPPLVYFNLDTVLGWCGGNGVSDEALGFAKTYLRIVLFSHFFSHIGFGLSAMMRAEGAAVQSMAALAVGFGVNVVLDPFFIFTKIPLPRTSLALPGLGLGIEGAAFATVIGMFASFLYAVWRYLSGRTLVKFKWRCIGFHRGLVLKPCGIGLAPFLQQLFGAAINVVLPLAFAKWAVDKAAATTQIASLGVFQSVMILVVLPVLGTQQGLQPIIGYNWGARNFKRVRSTLFAGFSITTILCFAATVLQTVPPFPRLLASLFVSSDNPALLDIASRDLAVSNCMLWCISLNIVATTYFQSIGRPLSAIVLSTLRQGACLIPAAWFLPYFISDHALGVWLAMPFSDVACCLMTAVPAAYHLGFLKRVRFSAHEKGMKT
ncbi:MAG: MATE family efflux transporter [Kiritimatiellae bacterium]|nr:MATE family efflux transporter [Kiritimatiellia bacterium]